MAVTKLMHMKESPGCLHDHLRNAIDYVLDVKHGGEKTGYGRLVGGNSGLDHEEILENFLETKRDFGKLTGRQGYHFVISFAKGETDKTTAYEVVREFCEAYLGDDYDYVFAIHTDKEHLHGHIIFNSVSRADGYKYHYKKGDWKEYIQPVTDEICKAHGLSPLVFEEDTVGVSYASWASEKEGKINWTHIIQADVDLAIQRSDSFEEFQREMAKMNYRMHLGYSRKHKASYITFSFVGPDGKEHKRRSYNLSKGYSPREIMERTRTKEGARCHEQVAARLAGKAADYLRPGILKGTKTYKRLYQAVTYYQLPNPYAVPAYRVRRDMLRLDRLIEECSYMKTHHLTAPDKIQARVAAVDAEIRSCADSRRLYSDVQRMAGETENLFVEQYHRLQKELDQCGEAWNERTEEIEDEMAAIATKLPDGLLEAEERITRSNCKLKELREEKRILSRILDTEWAGETKEPVRQKTTSI